jgi:hypothetical protein
MRTTKSKRNILNSLAASRADNVARTHHYKLHQHVPAFWHHLPVCTCLRLLWRYFGGLCGYCPCEFPLWKAPSCFFMGSCTQPGGGRSGATGTNHTCPCSNLYVLVCMRASYRHTVTVILTMCDIYIYTHFYTRTIFLSRAQQTSTCSPPASSLKQTKQPQVAL